MEEDNNRIVEVDSPDNFSFQKQETFSHPLSVQKAYYRVLDCLSKEMVEGFWEDVKNKDGKIKPVLHNDTRKEAVESVKTLKNCMISDLQNTTFLENIKNLLLEVPEVKKQAINEQKDWWNSMSYEQQQNYMNQNKIFVPCFLNEKLPFIHEFRDDELSIYRDIFEQLELCLAKKEYFKKKSISNRAN